MCTSLTLTTKDNKHLLARTMDFPMEFGQSVHFIPRKYKWVNAIDNSENITKLALVGMAAIIDKHPVFADGVNEKGLACATLYLPGFAKYDLESGEKFGLASYDFVLWMLSKYSNIEEIKEDIKNITFVEKELSLLKIAPPFHWIVTDKSGKSIVVEKTEEGLEVHDNPVGVMTNSPNFKWHLENLRQYIGVHPMQNSKIKLGELELSAFGQGSGTLGLPGDYTPPSRFVRAAYSRQNILDIEGEFKGISGAVHALNSCNIPKGIVMTTDRGTDFTIYTSAMCTESGKYYYSTYENRRLTCIDLFKEDLDSKEIKSYHYKREEDIEFYN
ncbi:choloylglycine hydrolase family protein [Clostridium chrysemydis]|uniref:choloylglycine hydrolase family protein n=1 Tax=Clostridium chrysemydis TaxID=2665504 RepID=UPI00188398A8|nr:choloylglycine hydrolase family protein [Clostridium chrysemydis]